MQDPNDTPNTALTKIYGAIEHLLKHTDIDFLVKRLIELESDIKTGSLYRLITCANYLNEVKGCSISFSLNAIKSNDSLFEIGLHSGKNRYGDLLVGFYFPPEEFDIGDEVELRHGTCEPGLDIPNKNDDNQYVHTFTIDKHNKIYKPIDDLYYYHLIPTLWTTFQLLNPMCKTFYALYALLDHNPRHQLMRHSVMHPLSNGLFLKYDPHTSIIIVDSQSPNLYTNNPITITYAHDHHSNIIKKWILKRRDDLSKIKTVDELHRLYPDCTLCIEI